MPRPNKLTLADQLAAAVALVAKLEKQIGSQIDADKLVAGTKVTVQVSKDTETTASVIAVKLDGANTLVRVAFGEGFDATIKTVSMKQITGILV